MASEIHKKRTGKSFRISEEIVQKEEMYEEEDDDVPRSYRLLGPHMQTASAEMNSKLEAYMSSRLAMSAYMSRMDDNWRENNINQMFAAAFPNLGQQAQHLGKEMFPEGQVQSPQSTAGSVMSPPKVDQVSYQQQPSGRTLPLSTMSPPAENHMLTPGLTVVSSPEARGKSKEPLTFSPLAPSRSIMPNKATTAESAFTAELPQEMKLLLGGPPGMEMEGFGQDFYDQSYLPIDQSLYTPDMNRAHKPGEFENGSPGFYNDAEWDFLTQNQTQAQAQTQLTDEPWDTFINETAWDNNTNMNNNNKNTQ